MVFGFRPEQQAGTTHTQSIPGSGDSECKGPGAGRAGCVEEWRKIEDGQRIVSGEMRRS